MPIFALANAGVSLSGFTLDAGGRDVILGVGVGLVVGKPVGVLLATWLAITTRVARLPVGLNTRHLVVLGLVAGVGFTMALFVGQLAFGDETLLAAAKLAVLVASGIAAVLSLVVGRILLRREAIPGAASSADEAEASTET